MVAVAVVVALVAVVVPRVPAVVAAVGAAIARWLQIGVAVAVWQWLALEEWHAPLRDAAVVVVVVD